MIRGIMMVDTPLWIIIVTVLVIYILSLRKRMAGLKDPKLYLSRGERRAWAREQLAQEEEDRDAEQLKRNHDIVFGNPTHSKERN